jgi:hypothetical protein
LEEPKTVSEVTEITPAPGQEDDLGGESPLESTDKPDKPRERGQPRKDGFPQGSRIVKPGNPGIDPAYSVPNPKFQRYYSDHANAAQRTVKLWNWMHELPSTCRELIDIYIYRDWPPLLSAPDGSGEYDNIDKIPGTECFERDEDLNDRYGAGDYHCFINVGVKPHRRTIATAWIKGNRSFRDLPPCDKRITELGADGFPKYIDRNDPQTKTYVEYLRSRGIIPEVFQANKEKQEMESAATVKEFGATLERFADRAISAAEKQAEAAKAPPPRSEGDDTVKTVVGGLRDTISALQKSIEGGSNRGNDATAMLGIALEIADKISKANDAKPYLDIISKLNESVMALKMEMLNEKIESLRQPPAPAPAPAAQGGVGGLKGMIEDFRAIKELMGDMGGEAEVVSTATGWAGVVERGLPHIATLGQTLLQMYMASQMRGPGPTGMGQVPQPTPMPQPMPQAPPQGPGPGPVLQMQPLPPAPAPILQANGTPQAPGAAPAPDAQAILMNALNTIQVPLSNQLHDGLDGDDFADWFIGGFGEGIYRELTAYGAAALTMGMYSFPPIASRIVDLPREQVEKFVQEFCGFDGVEYDRKRERAAKEPTPIA